jgi:large subunit ribosomal protein L32e
MTIKKKYKPKRFAVMNLGFMKSVKERWRHPRGVDNKKRIRCAFAGPSPRIGYKNAEEVRYLHPCGMKEVLVHNMTELLNAGKGVVVRISAGIGGKKRAEIEKKAHELQLKIANAKTVKAEKPKKKEAKKK